jgi:glutamine amidotransferase
MNPRQNISKDNMIGIIDYGMGNLGSVENACRYLGLGARIVTRPEELSACSAVMLPGVGAFGDCMQHLQAHGLVEALRSWIAEGRPFLGICLGLQVLFDASEESPGATGLGVIPGMVKKFKLASSFKVPQIGWNQVRQKQSDCPLFRDIRDEAFFYFVHSYYVVPQIPQAIAGTTEYGIEYVSALWRDHLFAVQFHPEKSHDVGMQMLKNFGMYINKQGME